MSGKYWAVLGGLAAGLLLALGCATLAAGRAAGWQIECIDCPRQFSAMRDRSLRFDAQGQPHLAYGGNHLYYASRNASGWHSEVVDGASGVGLYAALALDSQGAAHISYLDETNGDLKYAFQAPGGWQVQTVDRDGLVGWYTSIAIDAADHPHISYCLYIAGFNNICDDLKYAAWDGSRWNIQVVDGDGYEGLYNSLALDPAGRPVVAYLDFADQASQVRLARWTGSGFTWEQAAASVGYGGPLSLALDSDGRAHISYINDDPQNSNSALYYAHKPGSNWVHARLADGMDQRNGQSSIVVTASGYPQISYLRGELIYARWTGSAWVTQTAAAGGYNNSLALDPQGRPGISYRQGDSLQYAELSNGSWNTTAVDESRITGGKPALALDSAGDPHVLYFDASLKALRYAYQSGGQWVSQVVERGSTFGGQPSLALDSAGRPHGVYLLNSDTHYAHWTGSSWVTQTVDSRGYEGVLALDEQQMPHVLYRTNGWLMYSAWDGKQWQTSGVAGGTFLGSDLALDPGGRPCVTYAQHINTGDDILTFACLNGSTWDSQELERGSEVGLNSSLAFDAAGGAHIGYSVGYPTHDLKYALGRNGTWQVETVDSQAATGQYPSLALDSSGHPWISYYSNSEKLLKLAHKSGGSWLFDLITPDGSAGQTSSLALEAQDQPVIACSDRMETAVLLARQPAPAALGLTHSASALQGLRYGQVLTFTLGVRGEGLEVRVVDTLPAQLEYVPGSLLPPATYEAGSRTLTWQTVVPAGGAALRFQARLVGTPAGSLAAPVVNSASATDLSSGHSVLQRLVLNARRLSLPRVEK